MVLPFQGFALFVSHDPGRCPGLACRRTFGAHSKSSSKFRTVPGNRPANSRMLVSRFSKSTFSTTAVASQWRRASLSMSCLAWNRLCSARSFCRPCIFRRMDCTPRRTQVPTAGEEQVGISSCHDFLGWVFVESNPAYADFTGNPGRSSQRPGASSKRNPLRYSVSGSVGTIG